MNYVYLLKEMHIHCFCDLCIHGRDGEIESSIILNRSNNFPYDNFPKLYNRIFEQINQDVRKQIRTMSEPITDRLQPLVDILGIELRRRLLDHRPNKQP
jgi:hypothetical protein